MDKILAKLKEEYSELLNSFVANPCPDWGAYQQRLGNLLGLDTSIKIIEDQKRLDEEFIQRE